MAEEMSCEESLEPVDLLQFKAPYHINTLPDEQPAIRYPIPDICDPPAFPKVPNLPGLTSISSTPTDSGLSKVDLSEILNSLFPAVEWTEEDGKVWRKEISDLPGSRNHVTYLDQNLTMALKQRQARSHGICPIRRELFAKVFDELIRQVTINNAERGVLLLRIRDELRMTLAAHERLFESSFAWGTRKANQVLDEYIELQEELQQIESEKHDLEFKIQELIIATDQTDRKHSESRDVNEKRALEDIQFLKRANLQLKAQLDGILGTGKKM